MFFNEGSQTIELNFLPYRRLPVKDNPPLVSELDRALVRKLAGGAESNGTAGLTS
jgi:hypothetical protein